MLREASCTYFGLFILRIEVESLLTLISWCIDFLIDCVISWLIIDHWSIDWLFGRSIGWFTDSLFYHDLLIHLFVSSSIDLSKTVSDRRLRFHGWPWWPSRAAWSASRSLSSVTSAMQVGSSKLKPLQRFSSQSDLIWTLVCRFVSVQGVLLGDLMILPCRRQARVHRRCAVHPTMLTEFWHSSNLRYLSIEKNQRMSFQYRLITGSER